MDRYPPKPYQYQSDSRPIPNRCPPIADRCQTDDKPISANRGPILAHLPTSRTKPGGPKEARNPMSCEPPSLLVF